MAPNTRSHDVTQTEQIEGEENQWKLRAPYRIQETSSFESRFEGGCHCGKVQFHIKKTEPLDAKYCHCTTCHALHGAPFGWTAIYDKEDINFTNGHHDLSWYDSIEKSTRHKLPCKVTCSNCHASIMDEGRNKILIYPATIKFKNEAEKKVFAGRYHMFYKERVMDVNDALPKWEGKKDESELVKE